MRSTKGLIFCRARKVKRLHRTYSGFETAWPLARGWLDIRHCYWSFAFNAFCSVGWIRLYICYTASRQSSKLMPSTMSCLISEVFKTDGIARSQTAHYPIAWGAKPALKKPLPIFCEAPYNTVCTHQGMGMWCYTSLFIKSQSRSTVSLTSLASSSKLLDLVLEIAQQPTTQCYSSKTTWPL